jgi:DNA ligase (NAD+)
MAKKSNISKSPKVLPDVATLTAARAKIEHKRLTLEIERHNRQYYQKDAPKILDAEYDALHRRLEAVEALFPDLVTKDSPSQKVGAAPARGFAKVQHAVPMLSLENAFGDGEVKSFIERVRSTGCPCRFATRMVISCLVRPAVTG